MGAKLHDVAVLDRPGLALVGVDDHGPRPGLAADCIPLAVRREARAAHAGERCGLEPRQHLVGAQVRRVARIVGLEQEAVRAVGDTAVDLVAVHPDRRQVAVADARDGELARAGPRAGAVAHRPGADANDVHRHLQERVERDDLVHLAAADAHVVGERVRELGRDRADLAANPPEVVEQPRARGRELREERGQGEDVRAPIIAAIRHAAYATAAPSAAPAITSVR